MKGKYQSVNEENFFKNMQYKQEYEVSALNDLIVSEYENDDEIYIVRMYNEEYVVGHGIDYDVVNYERNFDLTEDAPNPVDEWEQRKSLLLFCRCKYGFMSRRKSPSGFWIASVV